MVSLPRSSMHPVVVPRLAWNRLQHGEIVFAQHAKHFQRLFRIALAHIQKPTPTHPDRKAESSFRSRPITDRIRQLATISASARCATISAIDHFPGSGFHFNCFGVRP